MLNSLMKIEGLNELPGNSLKSDCAENAGSIMAKEENAIFTNMCMVYDGDKVLVQDRLDPDWPGVTFPGGHVEPEESFVDSVIREVYEETGLTIENPRLCGVQQWTRVDGGARYIVLFFKTDKFHGELKSSDEGEVFWINRSDIEQYVLADGFEGMLEVFENDELSENYYWFEDNRWKVENK